ncbi:hypothetical protein HCN44_002812 [Aphidius gifuensis]|uniref:Uncharacterized protein n=1 Tax=Aphidius gifuensis TaxID=684658 RepID=A0A835CSG8_APHGI|nr:hypothetical protein HCN44_002812 [Aphidius gifuensis]
MTSVKGAVENYPPGLSCINGTTTPNTLIFIRYNATEIPGHHVDLIMDGESTIVDLDFPLNFDWRRSVASSSSGGFSICFDVHVDEGIEIKEQPIDFDHREKDPFPNSLIKKIRPIPISKIIYAPSERKLKLRQLKINVTD